MKLLLAVAIGLPGGAVVFALLMQAAIGQNSYVTIGLALTCASGVWYLADMRQKIVGRLDSHEEWESTVVKQLENMVTRDALELELYKERARNDERYVKAELKANGHAAGAS